MKQDSSATLAIAPVNPHSCDNSSIEVVNEHLGVNSTL